MVRLRGSGGLILARFSLSRRSSSRLWACPKRLQLASARGFLAILIAPGAWHFAGDDDDRHDAAMGHCSALRPIRGRTSSSDPPADVPLRAVCAADRRHGADCRSLHPRCRRDPRRLSGRARWALAIWPVTILGLTALAFGLSWSMALFLVVLAVLAASIIASIRRGSPRPPSNVRAGIRP